MVLCFCFHWHTVMEVIYQHIGGSVPGPCGPDASPELGCLDQADHGRLDYRRAVPVGVRGYYSGAADLFDDRRCHRGLVNSWYHRILDNRLTMPGFAVG
jgi:hypothetical protein